MAQGRLTRVKGSVGNIGFSALKVAYSLIGYNLVEGSLQVGGVLHNKRDCILDEKSGLVYKWLGSFPKPVKADNPYNGFALVERVNALNARNPRYVKLAKRIPWSTQNVQDIINENKYTFFGQQGFFIDLKDDKLYLGYQTLGGEGHLRNVNWIVVIKWSTGEYLTKFSTDSTGAPEGMAILHHEGRRILLLPEYSKYTTQRYELPDVISEKSHLISTRSYSTGSRYQLGYYGGLVAIRNDTSKGLGIHNDNGNRVDIYESLGFKEGTDIKKVASLPLDNTISGRWGGKPKRQGLTMGDNVIITSTGTDTPTSNYKTDGIFGYQTFNLDGRLKDNGLCDPESVANALLEHEGIKLKTLENEGCCCVDIDGVPEIFTCNLGIVDGETSRTRSVLIFQHNCVMSEGVYDLSESYGANVQLYNDLPSSVRNLNEDSPNFDSIKLSTATLLCDYMIAMSIGSYSLINRDWFTVDKVGHHKLPPNSSITVCNLDNNTFRVTWRQPNGWQGDILLSKDKEYTLDDSSYNRLQSSPLPTFSGTQGIGIVSCPQWAPTSGNGFLFETGYSKDRVGQIFVDTGGTTYTRYCSESNRGNTNGWKKLGVSTT